MNKKPLQARFALFTLFVLTIALATSLDIFQQQEFIGYDSLMIARPARKTHPDIVIIEIADDTLKGLGRWPLPRQYHALLIKALSQSQAKLIVFDILFSEPSAADEVFSKAMKEAGTVLLPVAFQIRRTPLIYARAPRSQAITGGIADSLRGAASDFGHINIFIDPDGKVRRLPLVVEQSGQMFPSLGLLAAAKYLHYPLKDISVEQGKVIIDGQLVIPTEGNASHWINFPGQWTETFLHFSYIDILKAYTAKERNEKFWLDLSVFKDKICFIGLTATGTSDLRATPLDTVYPMIGSQASVASSILQSDYIRRPPRFARTLINLIFFLIAASICLRLAPLASLAGCTVLSLFYVLLAWFLFKERGVYIDLFLPLASCALTFAAGLFYKFFQEAQKRRLLEQELEIASSIQQSFLPAPIQNFRGIDIRAMLKPAKFVAGDFYDLIVLDENTIGVFIGDVAGKGISAALLMAQGISLLRMFAVRTQDPGVVLTELNRQLVPILKGRFITGQYIVINTKEKIFVGACAGHPSLLLRTANNDLLQPLPASGPPLGLIANISYMTMGRQLDEGDTLFMFTDGWTESRDRKGKELGLERLKALYLSLGTATIDEIFQKLQDERQKFEGADQHDDITAIIMRQHA